MQEASMPSRPARLGAVRKGPILPTLQIDPVLPVGNGTGFKPLDTTDESLVASGQLSDDVRRLLGEDSGAGSADERVGVRSRSHSPRPVDLEPLDLDAWAALAAQGDIITLARLGEGAGGAVSKCRLRRSRQVFVIKTISSDPNPQMHRQILRELEFNMTCDSPYIAQYYGAFVDPSGLVSIAMEYCAGGSLDAIYKHVRERGGRTGERPLGKIAHSVLCGLRYLHDRRIIHRDIKPSNILLSMEGQVKLCDFGVSGELVDSLAGTFTGTSYYMAPERIRGEPYTVTSDVWSLGLALMEVACNRFPFPAAGEPPLMPIELLTYIVDQGIPDLADEPEVGVRWTDAFRHFLRACLTKDPKERYSPRQMLQHPWIVGHANKKTDMAAWLREVWSL